MNEDRKPLGLNAFEMPDDGNIANSNPVPPTIDGVSVVEPTINAIPVNAPVIDSVSEPVSTLATNNVSAPIIDNVAGTTSIPVIDNVVGQNSPVVNNVVEPEAPTIDSVFEPVSAPVTNNISAPIIDNVADITSIPVVDNIVEPISAPIIDNVVETVNEPVTYNNSVVNPMPEVSNGSVISVNDMFEQPVMQSATPAVEPVVENQTISTPENPTPVENFDYNFDFENQVNTNVNYGSAPVINETPVEEAPVVPTPVVPILMPEDQANITSGNTANEGIVNGPGNQMSNSFESYINDNSVANNTLRTAEIVKEEKREKSDNVNVAFLIVIFGIIALFIMLLPKILEWIG